MADPLVVTIPHKLGKDEALRRIKPALGKASASFPVLTVEEEVWSGDSMIFRVRALGQVGWQGRCRRAERAARSDTALAAAQIRGSRAENHRRTRPDSAGQKVDVIPEFLRSEISGTQYPRPGDPGSRL
jgi:hypothetical protein